MSLPVLKGDTHSFFMRIMPGPERTDEFVSLLKLKDVARRLLPAASIARNVITAEPDTLPLAEALSKFKVFDALILEELGAARRPR